MVVEILVTECDPKHPLAHQRDHLMLDQLLAPHVVKAGSKPLRQPDRAIRRPQKQRTGVRSDCAPIECRHHLAAFNRCKSE